MTDAAGNWPLSGTKVLELGHIVAGPSAGLILADLGADVMKIEQPDVGDAARNMPNYGSTFYFLNRNKRSLALDLKSSEAKAIFEKLVSHADVVVDNFSPGLLDRWGIGYDWARQVNPSIVYCSVNGFLNGPFQSRPFLDELAQMASGLAYMTGPEGQPLRAGASIVDIGAASYAVIGILAALVQRSKTETGAQIKSGLFETAVFWVGQHIARTQLTGKIPESLPTRAMGGLMGWAVYQIFVTKDNRQIFIALTSNKHWSQFCRAMELTQWINDPELKTNKMRVAARDRIIGRITELISKMDFDEITEIMVRENLPYAPVNNPRDLLADEHLNQRNHWLTVHSEDEQALKMPSLPVTFDSKPYRVVYQPPRLGEHSEEILKELGFSSEKITEMNELGYIQCDGGMLQIEQGDS